MITKGIMRILGSKVHAATFMQLSLIIVSLLCQVTLSLKYYYGDGSYYSGNVDERGRPSGHGEFHNISGALEYDGDFFEGHPHGHGTWYGNDGTVFKGEFRYGRSSGRAIHIKPNGDRIEGDFLNLRPHGNIVFTTNDGKKDAEFNVKNDRKEKSNHEDNEKTNDSPPHDKSNVPTDSIPNGPGNVIRIEGDFRNGMAHGKLRLWYRSTDGKIVKIEGMFRMGQPHGYFTFMNEDDTVIADGKYLNGHPLENVHGRSSAKNKPHLLKIPRKIIL